MREMYADLAAPDRQSLGHLKLLAGRDVLLAKLWVLFAAIYTMQPWI